MKGRLIAALGVALMMAAVGGGAAQATAPAREHVSIDDGFPDDSICSFVVDVQITGSGESVTYFDAAGNAVRVQTHLAYDEMFSANGRTIDAYGHATFGANLVTGEAWGVGLAQRFTLSDGRTILLDVGRVVFDANGNITLEAGPHPFLHRDEPEVCTALA